MNKKGALELSITAIVVLIIAITLLGLAIFFIRNLFSEGTELFTGELAKIKGQLAKSMEESGETVIIDKGERLEVKRGERFSFNIGVRNTEDTRCFRTAFYCISPASPGRTCIQDMEQPILVGGMNDAGDVPVSGAKWFPTIFGQFQVPTNDIVVNPATLQITSKTLPDMYMMELQVFKANTEDCNSATEWSKEIKRFFIILS